MPSEPSSQTQAGAEFTRRAAYASMASTDAEQSVRATQETDTLWSETEGQVVNAWTFVLAVALCWLIVPVGWALLRYFQTANHHYTLTNVRLLEQRGIFVKRLETVELYRVKDLSVGGTLLQRVFGRGRVTVLSTDASMPVLRLNAVSNPLRTAQLIRDTVEACRAARGVRAFDF